MAISPQRLTIYLYSPHRAVVFAIAQLSCCYGRHDRLHYRLICETFKRQLSFKRLNAYTRAFLAGDRDIWRKLGGIVGGVVIYDIN